MAIRGEDLKTLMSVLGVQQSDIAKSLGITASAVCAALSLGGSASTCGRIEGLLIGLKGDPDKLRAFETRIGLAAEFLK